jgi:hypothetical protein
LRFCGRQALFDPADEGIGVRGFAREVRFELGI